MTVLGVVWLILLVIELTAGLDATLEKVGYGIWFAFLFDFALQFAVSPRKVAYLKTNWITALSLVLPALRVFRFLRAIRVLRAARVARGVRLLRVVGSLNRGMGALGESFGRRGFAYVSALTIAVIFGGAAGMYAFERDVTDPAGLHDYPTALWWTAMLVTTMGSQYWPQTGEGRALCLLIAIYAFAIFGYVAATFASFFIDQDIKGDHRGTNDGIKPAELNERLGVIIKNLSIVNPTIRILAFQGTKARDPLSNVLFLNVRVFGTPKVQDFSKTVAATSFFFCQFEQDANPKDADDYQQNFFAAFSWHKPEDDYEPFFSETAGLAVKVAPLREMWVKGSKHEPANSRGNLALFQSINSRFGAGRRQFIEQGYDELKQNLLNQIFTTAARELPLLNTGAPALVVDQVSLPKFLAEAKAHQKNKHLFLEFLSLSKAKAANLGQPDTKIDAALAENRKQISTHYGCQTSYSGKDIETTEPVRFQVLDFYRSKVAQISKFVAAMGAPDSKCSFEIVAAVDKFRGYDSGNKVVSVEQKWKEDPQVKAMREMYRAAAARAAEDASRAQFANSLNRLQSTANQLHQNRNKIESRPGGTYLVMNNKRVTGNSDKDTKGLRDNVSAAKRAQGEAENIQGGMIKDKVVTVKEFYKNYEDDIQYKLVLRKGAVKKVYEFPPERLRKSHGPCKVETDNKSNWKFDVSGTHGCWTGGFSPSAGPRITYTNQYLVSPTDSFLVDQVYPQLLKEVQLKRAAKKPEAQLDGMILAGLLSGEATENPEYDKLMQKVFGEVVPISEVNDRILAGK